MQRRPSHDVQESQRSLGVGDLALGESGLVPGYGGWAFERHHCERNVLERLVSVDVHGIVFRFPAINPHLSPKHVCAPPCAVSDSEQVVSVVERHLEALVLGHPLREDVRDRGLMQCRAAEVGVEECAALCDAHPPPVGVDPSNCVRLAWHDVGCVFPGVADVQPRLAVP